MPERWVRSPAADALVIDDAAADTAVGGAATVGDAATVADAGEADFDDLATIREVGGAPPRATYGVEAFVERARTLPPELGGMTHTALEEALAAADVQLARMEAEEAQARAEAEEAEARAKAEAEEAEATGDKAHA